MLLLLLVASMTSVASASNCPVMLSVPLIRAELLKDGRVRDAANGAEYAPDAYWNDSVRFFGCPCRHRACALKCCPPTQRMGPDPRDCVAKSDVEAPETLLPNDAVFKVYAVFPCRGSSVLVNGSSFRLLDSGALQFTDNNETQEPLRFCVDVAWDGDAKALVCLPQKEPAVVILLSAWRLASMPFLIATLFVLMALPAVREDAYGKCSTCLVLFLVLAHVSHIYSLYTLDKRRCISFGNVTRNENIPLISIYSNKN